MQNNSYADNDIKAYSFKEHVRKRPGMYIGGIDTTGKRTLIFNVLDDYIVRNSDQSIILEISLKSDNFIEICFPSFGVEEDFEGHFKMDNDLNNFEVIKILCQYFEIRKTNETSIFKKGDLISKTINSEDLQRNALAFQLDKEIFDDISLPYESLSFALKSLAFLNKNLKIVYKDERKEHFIQNYYHYTEGVKGYLKEIQAETENYGGQCPIFHFEEKIDDIAYEIGFYYDNYLKDNVLFSFANNKRTRHHGSLVNGIIDGILETAKTILRDDIDLCEYRSRKNYKLKKKKALKQIRLVASVKMDEPRFLGSTREELGEPIVFREAKNIVFKKLYAHFTSKEEIRKKNNGYGLNWFMGRFYEY